MAVSFAVWSAVVTPGKSLIVEASGDIKITNISLGDELEDESGRTTLRLVYHTPSAGDAGSEDEDKPALEPTTTTILGSLTPGKIEQTTLNVVLEAETEYLFETVGENTIYLTGNYIDQMPDNVPYNDDSDEDEDDYDLQDVSSDVEFEADEMEVEGDSSRFEEVDSDAEKPKKEEPKKANKKRAREEDSSATQPSPDAKLSKAEKKKLNKKLKGEDGNAVPAGAEAAEKKQADEPKNDKKEKKEKAKKVEEGDKKSQPESRTLDGGISVIDHKAGSGQKAKKGDTVLMRYVGKLQNGKTFDSNTKGQPFRFTLGKGEVIKGWDIGIAGMQVGGERVLTIPPAMAYGKKGQGPIPANSTLRFEVKLLQIA